MNRFRTQLTAQNRINIRQMLVKIPIPMILAIWMLSTISASLPEAAARQPAPATNPFAGTYCGYLDDRNYGSMSISDSGDVSGYFSYSFPNYFESFRLSGSVSPNGVMRLKVVHTITVSDRGRRTRTDRYSLTLNVTLDESGNLVATSGASFVLSPCQ